MPDDKLTGTALKDLIVGKWDRMHQVTINRIREGIPLINAKYFFCLEIDWHYVNQLGFEMVSMPLFSPYPEKNMGVTSTVLQARNLSENTEDQLLFRAIGWGEFRIFVSNNL